MTTAHEDGADSVDRIRAELGKVVRETWVNYCLETGDTKPSHIADWDAISDWDREVDCRIGEAVLKYANAALLAANDALRQQVAARDFALQQIDMYASTGSDAWDALRRIRRIVAAALQAPQPANGGDE